MLASKKVIVADSFVSFHSLNSDNNLIRLFQPLTDRTCNRHLIDDVFIVFGGYIYGGYNGVFSAFLMIAPQPVFNNLPTKTEMRHNREML